MKKPEAIGFVDRFEAELLKKGAQAERALASQRRRRRRAVAIVALACGLLATSIAAAVMWQASDPRVGTLDRTSIAALLGEYVQLSASTATAQAQGAGDRRPLRSSSEATTARYVKALQHLGTAAFVASQTKPGQTAGFLSAPQTSATMRAQAAAATALRASVVRLRISEITETSALATATVQVRATNPSGAVQTLQFRYRFRMAATADGWRLADLEELPR
jgi:hypothetical protein